MPEVNLIGRRLETPPTKTTHRRVGAVSRPRPNARDKSDRSAPGDASYEKHTPPRRSRRLETPPTKTTHRRVGAVSRPRNVRPEARDSPIPLQRFVGFSDSNFSPRIKESSGHQTRDSVCPSLMRQGPGTPTSERAVHRIPAKSIR